MSYRCGIDPTLARMMGVEPGGPRVKCDSCGLVLNIRDDRPPPKWLLENKPAPGWKMIKTTDGMRTDTCKRCRTA